MRSLLLFSVEHRQKRLQRIGEPEAFRRFPRTCDARKFGEDIHRSSTYGTVREMP